MAEKRRDNRGRILKDGETQQPDGRYRYRYVDAAGERQAVYSWRLVSTDKTPAGKKDCPPLRELEKQIQKDLQDGINGKAASEITLNELIRRYMTGRKIKETTRALQETFFRLYIKESIGELKVSDIKYSTIRKLYNDMIERGLSIGTLIAVNNVLHPALNLAVKDDLIRRNPTDGALEEIRKGGDAKKAKQRHALTKPQQEALVEFVKHSGRHNRWLPLITCLLGTGCRITEMLGLTWGDVDFRKGIISINHTLQYKKFVGDSGYTFHILTPKTDKGKRVVPLLDDVRRTLLEIRKAQMQFGIPTVTVDGYSGFIFTTLTGNPHSISGANAALTNIVNAYNRQEVEAAKNERREAVLLPHISAHILRHTFVTRLCEVETNLKAIQEIVGHSDISTTMNVYAMATEEVKQEVFKNLEGKIKIS